MPDDAVRLRRTHTPEEVAAVAGLPIGEVEWLIATGRLRAIRLADGGTRVLHSALVGLLDADWSRRRLDELLATEDSARVDALRAEIRGRLPAGQVLEEGTNAGHQADRLPYAAAFGDGPSRYWAAGATPGRALAACADALRRDALVASLAELGWSVAAEPRATDGIVAVAPDGRCWAIAADPADPDEDPDDRIDELRNLAEEHGPAIVDTVWLVPAALVADPAGLAPHLAAVPPGGLGLDGHVRD